MIQPKFLKKINDEVFYLNNNKIDFAKSIKFVEFKSKFNFRGTVRICFHKNTDSKLHQMMICHQNSFNVLPHIHFHKSELCLVLKGSMDVFFYDKYGKKKIKKKLDFKKNNFLEIPENTYHSMKVTSKRVIFLETTKGPFNQRDTFYPNWS